MNDSNTIPRVHTGRPRCRHRAGQRLAAGSAIRRWDVELRRAIGADRAGRSPQHATKAGGGLEGTQVGDPGRLQLLRSWLSWDIDRHHGRTLGGQSMELVPARDRGLSGLDRGARAQRRRHAGSRDRRSRGASTENRSRDRRRGRAGLRLRLGYHHNNRPVLEVRRAAPLAPMNHRSGHTPRARVPRRPSVTAIDPRSTGLATADRHRGLVIPRSNDESFNHAHVRVRRDGRWSDSSHPVPRSPATRRRTRTKCSSAIFLVNPAISILGFILICAMRFSWPMERARFRRAGTCPAVRSPAKPTRRASRCSFPWGAGDGIANSLRSSPSRNRKTAM